MAVFVTMLMIRYVPGAVLKGDIVEEAAELDEVDDVAEEDVGVGVEERPVDCCC